MFGDKVDDMPIVQVSIERSDDPEENWAVGKAISKLREEGILVLVGGLTINNLHDRKHFVEKLASPDVKMFDQAIIVHGCIPIPGLSESCMLSHPTGIVHDYP
ncbi:hypothetical protein EV702DRAFT_1094357 [Suillus placidus]|uniref:Uncharacterized protein n=1 Tax=Suillus placidus TaxID=48579 RepID=A0A9P7D3X5_9AGAM|nr:hypothetical protein EV702DRAFT_1094357 [Suillus placidus]